MDHKKVIRETHLFEFVSDDILTSMAKVAKEVDFSRGDLIFDEAEEAEYLYILLNGKISMGVSLTSQPTNVTVSVVNAPNTIFGWSSIVTPYRFTAFAQCDEDTKVLAIPGEKILDILQQDPPTAYTVMKRLTELISSRLRDSRTVMLRTL
ncbi:MAG: cyclic nucleotide-binding domain-containing protein [Anaerolineales bacterium]|nr:cyclic nucleotide-binding domain-containing protein [Chloroflexota bacterium]MBL6980112.1 cyclic nucleotide-binding domain-containing protein [Anaerolineales bacterium]